MKQEIISGFTTIEVNDYVRGVLLQAMSSQLTERAYFTFNVYNVMLDFENKTALIDDELDVNSYATLSFRELRELLTGVMRVDDT